VAGFGEGAERVRADALRPVADALLDKARREAARIRTEARAAADAQLAQARAEADQILAGARTAGHAEAAASARTERVRARRRARSIVLTARRESYEELRWRVRSAVAARCAENPETADLLRRVAADQAGPDARILTAPDGGVIAVAPGHRVDCSVPALAEHAVDLLGAEVERLWAS
jgi:vacuolar-type H+-ATPase subunit E/Vma4